MEDDNHLLLLNQLIDNIKEVQKEFDLKMTVKELKKSISISLNDALFFTIIECDNQDYIDDDLILAISTNNTDFNILLQQPLLRNKDYDTINDVLNILRKIFKHDVKVVEKKNLFRKNTYEYKFI